MEGSFLTTRIKRAYEDYWRDIKRVFKYLKGTKHMKILLRVESLSVVKLWIDDSYNTHEY